ncbi:MAG: dTDP-glucose 4,6-dehydratase [Nitrospiraceae bacterium]|nr:MAG: dTDP-glucose 4,6-dehydratase [Nitrospiraceae bacterium]
MRVLVTGGAGFIGSHFVRLLLQQGDMDVVNLDALRYSGNLDNLRDIEARPQYAFVRGDICDAALVERVVRENRIEAVVNFAAETHVDRSILEPGGFVRTDVVGTSVLLEAARACGVKRFVQVSTDEVYGDVSSGRSKESDPLAPRSPYSASKAGGDLLALSYFTTYRFPVMVTRGSNTFGPNQYPEKFIPLFVTNAIEEQPLPLYGDGLQQRDWLYVQDHCEGIALVLAKGEPGQAYNVGVGEERPNREVAEAILDLLGKPLSLIRHVTDRPGHDRRYALDCGKIAKLGWSPRFPFGEALKATVAWYRDNAWWWQKIKSGEFRAYYEKMYGARLRDAQGGR